MGPSNSSYLSKIAIFHFYDYGRKSKWSTILARTAPLEQVQCSNVQKLLHTVDG